MSAPSSSPVANKRRLGRNDEPSSPAGPAPIGSSGRQGSEPPALSPLGAPSGDRAGSTLYPGGLAPRPMLDRRSSGSGLGPSSLPPSSLPPSSPPAPFSELGGPEEDDSEVDERERIRDADSEGEGEDLFGDNMIEDYGANERLDRYDDAGLNDSEEFEAMDAATRFAAERRMDRRDRREAGLPGAPSRRRNRAPAFLRSDSEDSGAEAEAQLLGRRRRRRQYDEVQDDNDNVYEEELPLEQLSDIKANSLKEWIDTDAVKRTIMREFRQFLMSFTDESGTSTYGERIKSLGEQNLESLEVSFSHLSDSKAILAYFLTNCPSAMLSLFDTVALEVILIYYPEYERIHPEVHVRITELPGYTSLRDLRQGHLDGLVRVSGVVTRRGGIMPQLKYVKFDCGKCGDVLGPFFQDATSEVRISFCSSCGAKGPFTVNSEQTVYRNYQKMTLQESPGSVPAGRLPRHREVILLWDLIDSAKPGEEIEVTGIYRNNFDISLNIKNGFPVFSTVLEANYINKKEDLFAAFRLTEEDEKQIRTLSRDERIRKRIIKSIAPSIYGHEDIKTAVALSLFGGVPKNINNKHRIRGDINVLLLGDPGTAKSQVLRYVANTAHRAVTATGQGASAVGLTASVRKDPITREWTLEGGALVLADKGVCLIDEFDKMNEQDRVSIHEVMEQQTISISKAGIVTTLQARCSIIAAANPIRGRYNPTIPFSQNVELTEPILSRFDVLCVVKDTVDPVIDEMLAKFVVGSHLRSHPDFDAEVDEVKVATSIDAEILPQDVLKKYIQYARERCQPKLGQMDQDKLARLYSELRRESIATGSFPITVRHLESTIRMAEASAKMRLSEYVRSDDIDLAIQVTVGSFVGANKTSVKKQLDRGFAKYLRRAADTDELLSFTLGQITKDKVRYHVYKYGEQPNSIRINLSELADRAKDLEIFDVQPFLQTKLFRNNGYRFANDAITKTFGEADGL
ncbi:uncharacterized protein L969DRAFT_57704 [Mixia osmundae IAM 14324]|uniref:uncharacterized protein n=1 Tax=Mixia osmundae (strain CBS 9802 / IAM 14324 / JCM 22182 / KY 12970) TaxID=764103 RepID=UPI0004A54C66|nr:uncharacterized protein L969DRAFT_57704 [Mixia osmundae IAM 14324]KEI42805.1 hypothetical protein L969DRAFT_57704 [Mixia osmundae IAM 14324]